MKLDNECAFHRPQQNVTSSIIFCFGEKWLYNSCRNVCTSIRERYDTCTSYTKINNIFKYTLDLIVFILKTSDQRFRHKVSLFS